MSSRRDYIDPSYSPVEEAKQDRASVNIVTWNRAQSYHANCRVCQGVQLIERENGTILFCPSCGTITKADEAKYDNKIKSFYGPARIKKGPTIVSQSQKQRRKKQPEQEEYHQGLTEEDKRDLGMSVTDSVE